MFGVRENPKIRPQIRKVIALKSAHLDRAYHVISKKGNYLDFYNVRISLHPASLVSCEGFWWAYLRVEIGSLNYKNNTTNIM